MTKKEQIRETVDAVVEKYKKSGAKVKVRSRSYENDDTGDIELDIVAPNKNRIISCIEWDDERHPKAIDLYWISPSGDRSICKVNDGIGLQKLLTEFERDMEILLEKNKE